MNFELFLIKSSEIPDKTQPNAKKLIGDIIGNIELPSMPAIKSTMEHKNKKYKIESILVKKNSGGLRLELSKAGG